MAIPDVNHEWIRVQKLGCRRAGKFEAVQCLCKVSCIQEMDGSEFLNVRFLARVIHQEEAIEIGFRTVHDSENVVDSRRGLIDLRPCVAQHQRSSAISALHVNVTE